MTSLLTAALVGSQTPRISSRPDYVSSAGQEAIELAESAGLYLDPWQQLVLTESLGERRDGRWSAFEVGLIVPRQNGKGSVLEARELFGLFLAEQEKLIIHTSHLFATSLEAFRRIRTLIESTPDLDRKVRQMRQTTGQEMIELRDGSRLRFMARSKGAGRGLSGDLVVLDEAYELDDAVMEALLPTLLARPNPQVWYTSSPVLDSETGMPLTAMRKRGMAGDDPSLCYLEWSAETDANLDDRAAWVQSNPGLGYRVTEEGIARSRSTMTDAGFAREILCIWPPEGAGQWQVITKKQWADAEDASEPMQDPVALAVYLTPDRGVGAIVAAGARADADLCVEVVAHEPRADWIPARVVDLVRKWQPCMLVIDSAGAGANLIVEVRAALDEAAVDDASMEIEITTMNMPQVSQAYGMVHDALTRPDSLDREGVDGVPWRLWHRGDARLTAAVAGAVTRSLGREGTTWDSLAAEADLSLLVAATNAVWGFLTRPIEMVPLVARR